MVGKKQKKCFDCTQRKVCQDSFISWVFFVIGIISALAVRVVTLLSHLEPIYGNIAWYVGVLGFCLFFIYKFRAANRRIKVINHHSLQDKLNKQKLDKSDIKIINQILCGLTSKKERINYFIIFFLSALALIFAVYIDFFN
jgi:hypothetical protein